MDMSETDVARRPRPTTQAPRGPPPTTAGPVQRRAGDRRSSSLALLAVGAAGLARPPAVGVTGRRRRLWRGGRWPSLLVLTAGPAAADAPGPTNYRAEVTGLDPDVDGVRPPCSVGTRSCSSSVDPGHEVVVRGYDGEELYLRYDADGSVYENLRAATHYQNQSRYNPSAVPPPGEVGPGVPPDWQLVSTSGSYAWHDHRIHWMSPTTLPYRADTGGDAATQVDPSLDEAQPTPVWAEPVPITVDGQQVGIVGQLTYYPDASPLPAIVAAVLALAAVVALGWRSATVGVLAGAVGGGAVALAIGVPQVVGLAPGVVGQPLQVVVPLIALLVAGAGLSVRSRSPFAVVVASASGLVLLGWCVTNLGALTAPIVPPGTWPDALVRVAIGLVAGAGLGAVVVGVRDLLGGDALSLDPGPDPDPA